MNRFVGFGLLAVIAVVGVAIAQPTKSENVDTLCYRTSKGWKEIKTSDYKPFGIEGGGVRVEIPMGDTGLHPLDAILGPYDKIKDSELLLAYNKEKNIGLLSWGRWNSPALCLSSPDADEILAKHGFKCTALDVTRLLRLTYR